MTAKQVVTLTVGPMSHGGHCVARHEGRVVFVRHAVPGERVRAVVTEGEESAKFWRAETIDVLEASDHRRRHPWKQADSLRAHDHSQTPVGGADYGHISEPHQRRLKSQVFRDTMSRIGGVEIADLDLPGTGADGEVSTEALPGTTSGGLHWRTRVSFGVLGGSLAMKPHRSHALIPLRSMPLAVEAVGASTIFSWDFGPADSVEVVAPGGELPLTLVVSVRASSAEELGEKLSAQARQDPAVGSIVVAAATRVDVPHGRRTRDRRRRSYSQLRPSKVDYRVVHGRRTITEPLPVPVSGRDGLHTEVELAPEAFWQIHRAAPEVLIRTVDEVAELPRGGTAIDLYAGAGLFTTWAAQNVGPRGQVLAVEAAKASAEAAERLFADSEQVEVVTSPVERIADRLEPTELVLLDPPRSGAGRQVLEGVTKSKPGQICYVSCDPASFARDTKILLDRGFKLKELRLLDMYPNTHHMESVALFQA